MARAALLAESVILIGGSAGALAPLKTIVTALPDDLRAACLIVIHTSATGGVYLPSLIGRWTSWPVTAVNEPRLLHAGEMFVATSDRHLKVTAGAVTATREAREHHMRPAIDVLFRSAARMFGRRAVAIVLSGYGGDGAAGAIGVRARGGTVIVQDPDDADVPSMPLRTMATGTATHVAPAAAIAALVQQIVGRVEVAAGGSTMTDESDVEQVIAEDFREQKRNERNGQTAVVSCPDCGGVMWQTNHAGLVDFSCHIGHRYSADTLLVQKTEQLEAALATALRVLKEKAILLRQTATRARANGQTRAAERLEEQASVDERYAQILQRDLLEAEPSPLSSTAVDDEVTTVDRDGRSS